MKGDTQLSLEGVSIGYGSDVIIPDITFCIQEGDYVCIEGSNGSGKSTLIKTILGIIKPVTGVIVKNDKLKDNGIGYVPQQSSIQKDFPVTVREVVCSGLRSNKLLRNSKDKIILKKVVDKVGIEDIIDRPFSKLSGGQKQKVLVARALCTESGIVILDEPCNNLDTASVISVNELLLELNRTGVTVIVISHAVDKIIEDVDYVITVNDKTCSKRINKKVMVDASDYIL